MNAVAPFEISPAEGTTALPIGFGNPAWEAHADVGSPVLSLAAKGWTITVPGHSRHKTLTGFGVRDTVLTIINASNIDANNGIRFNKPDLLNVRVGHGWAAFERFFVREFRPITLDFYHSANGAAIFLDIVEASSSACLDFAGRWLENDVEVVSSSTSDEVPVAATQTIIGELQELRDLPQGWDGEEAAAPSRDAIDEAIAFVRSAGQLANRLEPTLHADGSVLLEIGDGTRGSLRFKGDHRIIYAIRDRTPGAVPFDGKTIPNVISSALAALA
jgi:hypothetical protein